MRRRFVRGKGLVLLLFAVIFSFGILGQVDTRMHIGGGDWDLDSVIYINVDDYIYDNFVSHDNFGQPSTSVETLAALDGVTQPVERTPEPTQEERVTPSLPELTASLELNSGAPSWAESPLQVATPPVPAPPKVQEKKEEVKETREQKTEEKPTIFVHKVNSGETLWDIANAYGTTVDSILSANELSNPNMLAVGQELSILSVQGVLHRVASGESLWEISERYQVSIEEITKANMRSPYSTSAPVFCRAAAIPKRSTAQVNSTFLPLNILGSSSARVSMARRSRVFFNPDPSTMGVS
jgi:LysM repeat protein